MNRWSTGKKREGWWTLETTKNDGPPTTEDLRQNWDLLCRWVSWMQGCKHVHGSAHSGTHLTCRTIYLNELAKQIHACIDEVQRS